MECSRRWRLSDLFGYTFYHPATLFTILRDCRELSPKCPNSIIQLRGHVWSASLIVVFTITQRRTRFSTKASSAMWDLSSTGSHLSFRQAMDETATICTSTAQPRAA